MNAPIPENPESHPALPQHKPLEAILAHDLSWQEPMPILNPVLRGLMIAQEAGIWRDEIAAKEIGSRALAFNRGDHIEHYERGQQIDLEELGPREVVKIVQDSRRVLNLRTMSEQKRAVTEASLIGFEKAQAQSDTTFEREAQRILDQDAYLSNVVGAVVRLEPSVWAAVTRRALYVGKSTNSDILIGIESAEVKDAYDGKKVRITPLPPELEVGYRYISPEANKSSNKIVAVSILEPSGVVWSDTTGGKKGKRKRKRRESDAPEMVPRFARP